MHIQKAVALGGNARFLLLLQREKPRTPTDEGRADCYTKDFEGKVYGKSGISGTAAYPVAFANAVAEYYTLSVEDTLAEIRHERRKQSASLVVDEDEWEAPDLVEAWRPSPWIH